MMQEQEEGLDLLGDIIRSTQDSRIVKIQE